MFVISSQGRIHSKPNDLINVRGRSAVLSGRAAGRRCRKRTRITFRSSISCLLLILPALWPQDEVGRPADNGFIYGIALLLVVLLMSDRYAREVVDENGNVAAFRHDTPGDEKEGGGGRPRTAKDQGRSRNSFSTIVNSKPHHQPLIVA